MIGARRYRIVEVLGQGGFGVVYRAELLGPEGFTKQVALKVMKNLEAPEEIIVRFRDEARILGLIRHRAVVRVDGLARTDQGWAVVMEYVDGVNVSSVVKAGGVPPSVALEIVEEVASALHHAYNDPANSGEPLRLVHRDIKPANVRLTPQGEVKVLDFGIARADFTNREAHTSSMHFGTKRYMSPERHDQVEGPECDVYATGLILAELLVGEGFGDPPAMERRHREFAESVQQRVSRALADTEQTIPLPAIERLVELVGAMIAYEASDRPKAREVVDRIRALRTGMPGMLLRVWAEEHVAALLEVRRRNTPAPATFELRELPSTSQPTGTLLPEPDGPPSAANTTVGRIAWLALLGTPVLGGLALVAVVAVAIGAWAVVTWSPSGEIAPASAESAPAAGTADAVPASAVAPDPTPAAPPSEPAEGAPDAPTAPDPADAVASPAHEPAAAVASPTPDPEPAAAVASHDPAPRIAKAAGAKPPASSGTTAKPPAPSATWTATGDAARVRLRSAGGTFEPGAVEPGSYEILAAFDGGDLVPAGSVTVAPDRETVVTCTAAFMTCSVRR